MRPASGPHPSKSNRKAKIRWDRRMYRERNRIERMIGHLKINRLSPRDMTARPLLPRRYCRYPQMPTLYNSVNRA
jgi:hypothetical protein